MKAIAFDTLEFAKRLRAAEFTEKQAEALAAAVAEIVESRLATKEDIALLQRDNREQIAMLQRNFDEKIAGLQRDMKELELRLKHDLTLRLGTMLAATVAIVAALVKML